MFVITAGKITKNTLSYTINLEKHFFKLKILFLINYFKSFCGIVYNH